MSDPHGIASASPEAAANNLICLVHQARHLPRRQLETLGQAFLAEGGFTQRLYRKRQEERRR